VGAEVILIPEQKLDLTKILEAVRENTAKGKRSGIIVAAEGVGDTRRLSKEIEKRTSSEVRLSIIGYSQRGGSPTARSRLLASLFAKETIDLLLAEEGSRIAVLRDGEITSIEISKCCKGEKPLDLSLLQLARVLAI
ncbi:6-phosphofructokinase, partial [Candidatus Bathyarchaeota archaeon]|nr:6-phosphofructokinase [Candidatus Bathyarchaeota archaeon]